MLFAVRLTASDRAASRLAMESPSSSDSSNDHAYVPYEPYEHIPSAVAPAAQEPTPPHVHPFEGTRMVAPGPTGTSQREEQERISKQLHGDT